MAVEKVNSSSSLAEVVDRILDKGIVVDAWVRVSLVGIELLAVEARIVIASVETYLKYAEAVGLTAQSCCSCFLEKCIHAFFSYTNSSPNFVDFLCINSCIFGL